MKILMGWRNIKFDNNVNIIINSVNMHVPSNLFRKNY